MNKSFVIAIDGPVASGKGTIAKLLSEKLNGLYLDTGATYRCVALYCLRNNINPNDEKKVESVLNDIKIDFDSGKTFINSEDVSLAIRDEKVSKYAPMIAGFINVRKNLIKRQREISNNIIEKGKVIIVEGRDIGSVVFPDADLKLFLTADKKVRALRRKKQNEERGINKDFDTLLREVDERDNRDTEINKTLDKEPKRHGYVVLDDSDLTEDETIDAIIKILKEKGLYD